MKKILFILFVAQFILAPYIIKGYGANLVEDNYEYSGVDQGRETVEKDILGNIIIRDDQIRSHEPAVSVRFVDDTDIDILSNLDSV